MCRQFYLFNHKTTLKAIFLINEKKLKLLFICADNFHGQHN